MPVSPRHLLAVFVALLLVSSVVGCAPLNGPAGSRSSSSSSSRTQSRPRYEPTPPKTKLVCKDKGNGKTVCKEKRIGGWW
jgi:hypothetical protein